MAFRAGDGWDGSTAGMLGRWALIILFMFLLLILSIFPFKIGHFGEIRPSFILMAIYYWAIMRPSTFPPLATFCLGIMLDLLAGDTWPLGVNAITLLAVQWIMRRQRKFMLGQGFIVLWMGLALVTLTAGLFQWLVYSAFNQSFEIQTLQPVLISAVMTSVIFPLIVLPLSAFNKKLAERQ
ncbi:MAG TPA: rod shape-determining protein MreD [Patescibacteria group bacterium]|nr:rod shape-determining protein MreD [Patescibacteria group bacterium]